MSFSKLFGCCGSNEAKYQKPEVNDKKGAFGLNTDDILLIQEDWKTVEQPDELGGLIFMRIFDQKPDVKRAFKMDDVSREDLPAHPRFISHSKNFSKFLERVVENLGSHEDLFGQTAAVSAIHTQMSKKEPMVRDEENWNTFYESALVMVMDAKRTAPIPADKRSKLQFAWRMLMARLVNEIKYSL